MSYYKKGRALVGGDHVSVGSRGKRAVVNKADNTKVIARRGKTVATNKKRYVVSVSDTTKKNQTAIKRRGKKVVVTKRVRSI